MNAKIKHGIKKFVKMTPVYPVVHRFRLKNQASIHRILHNDNPLFYTLSPNLLIGLLKAFEILKSGRGVQGGGYYEFGLFKGFSFWFAEQLSKLHNGHITYLYGFDSFQGLPESKVDVDPVCWAEGNYAASIEFVKAKLEENGADMSKIKLYKGFFSDEYFDKLREKEYFPPVSICVIDSDIYESCVAVLNFIKQYLAVGSILIFDDFNAFDKDDNHGERRALLEFEKRYPQFRKEHLFDYGWHGVAFRVISI